MASSTTLEKYIEKYLHLGCPIVKIHINKIAIPNTLIDPGATISVMTKNIMDELQLRNLRYTPIVSQLANRSTIKQEGVLEDILIYLDPWEYPIDFMVLTPKTNSTRYSLILGRPCLSIIDAFISFTFGDMTISNGNATKMFILYPLAKIITAFEDNKWIVDEDDYEII